MFDPAVPTICCGHVAAFVVVPKGLLLVSSASFATLPVRHFFLSIPRRRIVAIAAAELKSII
jgi:hypothetical protein